ncbi:UNVERIFIED_CONTAM: hypothetical protein FKN15_073265 [Acipenser sinensis]
MASIHLVDNTKATGEPFYKVRPVFKELNKSYKIWVSWVQTVHQREGGGNGSYHRNPDYSDPYGTWGDLRHCLQASMPRSQQQAWGNAGRGAPAHLAASALASAALPVRTTHLHYW